MISANPAAKASSWSEIDNVRRKPLVGLKTVAWRGAWPYFHLVAHVIVHAPFMAVAMKKLIFTIYLYTNHYK